jgi:hypothetical protein
MTRRETKHHALLTSVLRPPGSPHRAPTPHIHFLNEKLGIVFNGLLQNSLNQKFKWFFCPCCSVEHKSTLIRMRGSFKYPMETLRRGIDVLGSIVGSTRSYSCSSFNEVDQLWTIEFCLIANETLKKCLPFLETARPLNRVQILTRHYFSLINYM